LAHHEFITDKKTSKIAMSFYFGSDFLSTAYDSSPLSLYLLCYDKYESEMSFSMPKIVIVNEKDEIMGSAEKSDVRKNGQIHRIVRILLHDGKGNILLQKRHPKAQDSPNRWDFSVAGHVDENEDYDIAAKREMKEELDLDNVVLRPLLKFYAEKIVDEDQIRRFNMVFLGSVNAKSVRPNLNELGNIAWFTNLQIETMLREEPDTFSSGLRENYSKIVSYL
jgi:isopentenyl-diphosphate delta-isomerase